MLLVCQCFYEGSGVLLTLRGRVGTTAPVCLERAGSPWYKRECRNVVQEIGAVSRLWLKVIPNTS